jgi:type II secretory pathway predicted ATPase ExeA
MAETKDRLNYISQLDLSRDPFAPEPDLTFYYEYETLKNCYAVLNRLVQGDEVIILVVGEAGSGKTSLLKRFLTASIAGWKTGRIRIQPEARTDPDPSAPFNQNEIDSYPAYFLQNIKGSIIILDDAHELSARHLTYILKNTQLSGGSGNNKRFILFGEPQLAEAVAELTASLSNETAISKVFIPPMTREQTVGYLNYRLAVAGSAGKGLFRASVVKKIHRLSGGLPGRINTMADQQLQDDFSKKNQPPRGFFSWILDHEKALTWSAAGLGVLIIGVFVVLYYSAHQIPQPSRLTTANTVIRGKIDLTTGFTKSTPPIATARSSEKPQPERPALTEQTVQTPPLAAAVEKNIEIAATPREPDTATVPFTPQTTPASDTPAKKKDILENNIFREKWLLSQNASYYTIQILGVHDEKRLLRFIKNDLPEPDTNLAYYQTNYKGKKWYPLLYGIFPSQKEASLALKKLPIHIQKSSPWIRKLSSVQKAIQQQTKP